MNKAVEEEIKGLNEGISNWARTEYLEHSNFEYDKRASEVILGISNALKNNYPYDSPFYAGQMIKPPHPIARIAYSMALHINPNNHALDGGKASSAMEIQCVNEIARMYGWEKHLGHLTSGGTMANLEALWMARNIAQGKRIIASKAAHYTHDRISAVLNIPFTAIAFDADYKMNTSALEEELIKGDVAMVVATIGTTGAGMLDPLPEIIKLCRKYGVRVHADAAYGGYFAIANNLSEYGQEVFAALRDVDSLVIDPHKHGLVPYGCGCVLFNSPELGKFYKHDSPYTYFTSKDLHLGEISLECSRAGASAVALRAMMDYWPIQLDGEFSKAISIGRSAALGFDQLCRNSDKFFSLLRPELDIVIFGHQGKSTSEISAWSTALFKQAEKHEIFLALIQVPSELIQIDAVVIDTPQTTLLRSVMMKPEHQEVYLKIFESLNEFAQQLEQ